MSTLDVFIQGIQPVYKNLMILFTILLIIIFTLYISYILNDEKNYPVYMTENSFDLFLNKSNLGQIKSTTTVNDITINELNTLGEYQAIDFCPQGFCSVNLSTGIKICPSTVGNNSSNNSTDISVTYDKNIEICVEPEKCPPQLPYAIRNSGEAFDSNCDNNTFCYCTSKPQCATRVVKYFANSGDGKPGGILQSQLNYSFDTTGQKLDDNIHNNIIIEDEDNSYCKLNPAFTGKIVNGCNFANTWGEASGCQYTNNFVANNNNYKFTVLDYNIAKQTFNDIGEIKTDISNKDYPKGFNFLAISPSQEDIEDIEDILGIATELSNSDGTSITFNGLEVNGDKALLKNIRSNQGPGLPSQYNSGDTINVQTGYLINCLDPSNDKVNYKNMLTCVQPYNQPCTEGVLAYNIDSGSARNFCQGSGSSLIFSGSRNSLNNFFLINPAYFTLSCVVGAGCDDSIDSSLCIENDCSNAILEKRSKLFPKKDLSALSNLFEVAPASYGISYIPIVEANGQDYSIINNIISLETGDYWQIDNTTNGVFLTSNSQSGSSIINVNNSNNFRKGMSISFSQNFGVSNIVGTSIFLDKNLNNFDVSIARAGYEVIAYNNQTFFGSVIVNDDSDIKQKFQLYDIFNNQLVQSQQLNIENNSITFYKQFGFNGLNYNTYFDLKSQTRKFSNNYYYKVIDDSIVGDSPPFAPYQLFSLDRNNALLSENANFKQKYSMYYPVFNEEYFRQECVYCSPSFQSYLYITNGQVEGLNIQFSGQEYYHYGYGILNNNFDWNQISFGLTALDKNKGENQSNCSCIVLNESIPSLEVGDYVIDQTGFLNKFIVDNNGNGKAGNFALFNFQEGLSHIPDDKYKAFKLNSVNFYPNDVQPGTSFYFDSTKPKDIKNLFYGKTYFEVVSNQINIEKDYYIRPTVRITRLSTDKKTIFTDSPSIKTIPQKTIIQFISVKNNLSITSMEDPDRFENSSGSGLQLVVNNIALGRITSLNILNKGNGYDDQSPPSVYFNNYNPDTSILDISV